MLSKKLPFPDSEQDWGKSNRMPSPGTTGASSPPNVSWSKLMAPKDSRKYEGRK